MSCAAKLRRFGMEQALFGTLRALRRPFAIVVAFMVVAEKWI